MSSRTSEASLKITYKDFFGGTVNQLCVSQDLAVAFATASVIRSVLGESGDVQVWSRETPNSGWTLLTTGE